MCDIVTPSNANKVLIKKELKIEKEEKAILHCKS